MTSGITSSTTTDGQRKQYFRFVEDASEKALASINLDKDSLQQLIENGGEFQDRIITAIKELSITNQFADEEVSSGYGYLSGYQPKDVVAQTNVLRELFPGIGYANQDMLAQMEKGELSLPPGAEGFFAIPHWSKVGSTYQAAVEKVLDLLAKAYGGRFTNYRKGELGSNQLRETSKKARAMEVLQQTQNADILLVPAQFGLRHRGRSVRRARAVMNGSEFGLGAYEIGIMLLTHPDRLQNVDDLWLDCAGDEFSPGAGGGFRGAPIFRFDDGQLEFGTYWFSGADARYGSASGFALSVGGLPQ